MSNERDDNASESWKQNISPIERFTSWLVRVSLRNPLIIIILLLVSIFGGLMVMPFDWDVGPVPRNRLAVDAIPEIGENVQIVHTRWPGRSPRDVEDQITYPLTTQLMGIPRVEEIRTRTMLGMSFLFVVFEDGADYYWTRTRLLEKMDSLPPGTLPEGVNPVLGPDATALGQVFWYTLEGQDRNGEPTGGWSKQRLRSIQDWFIQQELLKADGVTEVAGVGGHKLEYQVDVDPEALRAYDVSLKDVYEAVQKSNLDVGAGVQEINWTEYAVRGTGFVEDLEDIRNTVIMERRGIPVKIKHVATVSTGPAQRRGVLDRNGAPAVGAVVVSRHGENPMEVIENLRTEIDRISGGLPRKVLLEDGADRPAVKQWAKERGFDAFTEDGTVNQEGFQEWIRNNPEQSLPSWGTVSQVTIVPFYDRTNLVEQTLNTLTEALTLQVLITVLIVVLLVMHIQSSLLISAMLPVSILMTFIVMKLWGISADIVALSGIAISIGTVVAMGIIVCENILRVMEEASDEADSMDLIRQGAEEVGGAALTAILTTVISFLPVFFMVGMAGRLFFPLAFTKTVAMVIAAIIALSFLPPLFHMTIAGSAPDRRIRLFYGLLLAGGGGVLGFYLSAVVGAVAFVVGAYTAVSPFLSDQIQKWVRWTTNGTAVLLVTYLFARSWMPLGLEQGIWVNFIGVCLTVAVLVGLLLLVLRYYEAMLRACLRFYPVFLLGIGVFLIAGVWIWSSLNREFRPELEEGSFLYMPEMSYHGSVTEAIDGVRKQDRAIKSIPEVEGVLGKMGRVESPLDPAPLGMAETIVKYKPEYREDDQGNVLRFQYHYDEDGEVEFDRDEDGNLIRDPDGLPYRNWREKIQSVDDIWKQIVDKADLPGWTYPSKLQPIETRLLMIQTGLNAESGVKLRGPDLETIEKVVPQLEKMVGEAEGVDAMTVESMGVDKKPYVEIDIDRKKAARYGVSIRKAQRLLEIGLGGIPATTTVEGRERYPIRVRYQRERRDEFDRFGDLLIPARSGEQVPLRQIADIGYRAGPQMIAGEDAAPVVYISFDSEEGVTAVEAVRQVRRHLREKQEAGQLVLPEGVTYEFGGKYKQQVKAQRVLSFILPVALAVIFLVLYLQFGTVTTTVNVFSGIMVSWAGGFLMLWLYGQDWFLNVQIAGIDFRELLNVQTINLSIAVWVGFLALFGIATDAGVLVATKLRQDFRDGGPGSISEIRDTVVEASLKRIRPCVMMIGVTVLALLPVITSTGKGSDVMIPIALPAFGGMLFGILTVLTVPVLFSLVEEFRYRSDLSKRRTELLSAATLFVVPAVYNVYCQMVETGEHSPS